MSKFVTCGKLDKGHGFSDIVCDITTGELIYCDDIEGNCIMSNLSLQDPIDIEHSPAADNILEYSGAEGVIMSNTYLIIINGDVAEYRDYSNFDRVLHRVEFDTDFVYEEAIV